MTIAAGSLSRIAVASQLGDEINARIAAHASQPVLRPLGPDELPWRLAEAADVLLVRPLASIWRSAPADPPPGWPGPVKLVMSVSAGIDFFPSWLLDAPAVTCARGVNAAPIAEYVLAAILNRAKRFDSVQYRRPEEFRQTELQGLHGQTLGLAGYGAIGQEVARRAHAFGMRILALRRSAWDADPGVEAVRDIAELAARSDHLVLALPATAQTRHIVDAAVLARAKPGLHLVNIARGALVDQEALREALDRGWVGAATLDVTDPEPLEEGHWLYTHKAVRLTPHISWSSGSDSGRLTEKLLDNFGRFVRGDALLDVVDPARGY
jgi:phosphoglycerate dehydrogenase-like enzyme